MNSPSTGLLSGALISAILLTGCQRVGPIGPESNDIDTLKRPDGTIVHCTRVPVEIINKSTKGNVDITLRNIGQVIKAGAGIEIDPIRVTTTSVSLNDYRVIARQLCLDYASGVYSAEEYKNIREKILPVVRQKTETEARVDSDFEHGAFIRYADRTRIPLNLRLRSVSTNNMEAGHVIFVLLVVHNEDMLPAGHQSKASMLSCREVSSCIDARLWDNIKDPIIIRGADTVGTLLSWTVDVKKDVKAIRVFWQTYQREADSGNRCAVDDSREGPKGGIPYLKVVDASGGVVKGAGCYRSYGDRVISL